MLGASRYESADPATVAELKRNEAVRMLQHTLAQCARSEQPATILQLRAGQRR